MGTSATGGDGAGGGTVAPPNNAGGGTAGGDGQGGGAGGTNGTAGATAAPSGLDRTKLPPLLQNMSEEQIGETFDTMFAALRRPTESAPPPPPPPPPKTLTTDDLRKRFDTTSDEFDPRGALRELVNENYGPLITDISKKANEGMRAAVRGMIPDFSEHEADIDKALEGVDPNLINQQVMVDTYLRVVGAKALRTKLADSKKPPTTVAPTPRVPDEQETKLSDEEIAVAKVMFRNAADPIAEFKKATKMAGEMGVSVKVPEGRK